MTELQRQRKEDQDEIATLTLQAKEWQQRKKTMEDHARTDAETIAKLRSQLDIMEKVQHAAVTKRMIVPNPNLILTLPLTGEACV